MKKFHYVMSALACLGISSCKRSPTPPQTTMTIIDRPSLAFEIPVPQEICQNQEASWSFQNKVINWFAYKGDDDDAVHGIIKAAGWINLSGPAQMEIHFSSRSLYSESELRDDRIKQYILGYLEQLPLKMVVTNLGDLASSLIQLDTDEISMNFEGYLALYGQQLAVSIPTKVRMQGESLLIKSDEGAGIELTQSDFLSQKIFDLLELAGVSRMDEVVDLIFEISLDRGC